MDPTTIAQILAARAQRAPTQQQLPSARAPISTPPQPLPSYLPQNVQNAIRTRPSFTEGGPQGVWGLDHPGGQEPLQPPDPQIADIGRLFASRRPSPNQISPDLLRKLYALPGFSGFTGGDDI
jgi:hypothetical protein